ncbi:MAG: CHAT domain-containing protein [Acidobacteriota bacterium]
MPTTPTRYVDLEIGLHRLDASTFQVEMRLDDPSSEAELPAERAQVTLDPSELLPLQADPDGYGAKLAERLFGDPALRGAFSRARATTEARDAFLRLRLRIGESALDLHALRWELLHDPERGAQLTTSERTLFSRFMVSRDWRPVRLRAKADLHAVIGVAAATDLDRYKLAAIDADGEIERAREHLTGIEVEALGSDRPLTLERLVDGLRGGVDIVYLVCHGVLTRRQVPYLLLQDDDGTVARVEGEALARAIAELQQAPRLIVLASCESAGTESGTTADGKATAEAALAPRLAAAGVPAVVAMQGQISIATAHRMMPVFFRELLVDGQIDRAMTVARGTVRDAADAWMPVLTSRLKRGRIWYEPSFSGDGADFSKWRSIVASVRAGTVVPIVGPDTAEHVYGSTRRIAERLSHRHAYPLAPHDRDDLAKVTQYLSVRESRSLARDEVVEHTARAIRQLHPDLVHDETRSLPKLLDRIVERQGDVDPLRVLAKLPARVFVNACPDPLLLKTLKAEGRSPQALLSQWRLDADQHPSAPDTDEPTPERPIVHHVFGVLGKADSLVMTEDDFFDYLIAAVAYKLIPGSVRGALTRGSLLFLGFRLDDWTFRVLFRLIMAQGGRQRLHDFAHVGVQVDPAEHDLADVEQARLYLDQYFGAGRDAPPISIYWGSSHDFLGELAEQLDTMDDGPITTDAEDDEDDWLG